MVIIKTKMMQMLMMRMDMRIYEDAEIVSEKVIEFSGYP